MPQPTAPSCSVTETATSDHASVIVDNQSRRVGEVLREHLGPGTSMSVVSAFFTIYAYGALKDSLEAAGPIRFLYGDPRGVGDVDPSDRQAKSFNLTDDGGIKLVESLRQKPLARACADWISRRVEIRTIAKTNVLHAKMYCIHDTNHSAVIFGSSNFTLRGLGLGTAPNIELNMEVGDTDQCLALHGWFEVLWNDISLTCDVKSEVIAALERIGKGYSPEFVYYKTLFHVFHDRITDTHEHEAIFEGTHFYDTKIWNALYQFQKDGATNAINRLLRHNGCIIADSVGLGKTWTALAVVKFFELRNDRVLVLCPKRLEQNWKRYTYRANYRNNPFDSDRLGYVVLAHTDLSRTEGTAGDIDLEQFNWGAFDLIVIDESHNFRNDRSSVRDEQRNRPSRYRRLLEEVIKQGVDTKVLMLSATPVNTSLLDLRNQIYLMTRGSSSAFKETLEIPDLRAVFKRSQRAFIKWEKERKAGTGHKKEDLIEKLGADFLSLLDAVTIARSRAHIHTYYPQVEEEIGGFPERLQPRNLHPRTDTKGELSYDDLHGRIGKIKLAIYMPSEYLTDKSELEEEKRRTHYTQHDREHLLIGMMRINLLKRLESSVHAFELTVKRILDKIDSVDSRISEWKLSRENQIADVMPDDDEEDEDFVIGKKREYRFADLDLDRWRVDLQEDRDVLARLYDLAHAVDSTRDAKLATLKEALKHKVESRPCDKDGNANPKALVFTTFSDTALYLYRELAPWAYEILGVNIALVTGASGVRTTIGRKRLDEVLTRFAPRGQQAKIDGSIEILIATDCLSEGQNLQDCDLTINYDIHWNPVRLMQRFGRIDRLGSRNHAVGMINFWPTENLDRYLDLKNRVEARMALADATATGTDDPLNDSRAAQDAEESQQLELQFRDEQLKRLRVETLDLESDEGGVTMSDLTLDDFIADLMSYIQQHRDALERAPLGICAIVGEPDQEALGLQARAGVIFCLKQTNALSERTPNRLQPYFLVYVRADGSVRFTFQQAKHVLTLFRNLSAGASEPSTELEDRFDQQTAHGENMQYYEEMLGVALRRLARDFDRSQQRALGQGRDATLVRSSEAPNNQDQFELVTWMVIADA